MKNMIFDYTTLSAHINYKLGGLAHFAELMQMPLEHAERPMNHAEPWSMEEMNQACEVLHTPTDFIPVLFFTPVM
jgi:hypothetical protein